MAPAGFTVTQSTDTGNPNVMGSLSWAIAQANNNPNSTIDFDFSGSGPEEIAVSGALPAITKPTLIDGFGTYGLMGLNGAGVGGDGLTVNSSGVQITGLAIYGFGGNGISLNGSGNYVSPSPLMAKTWPLLQRTPFVSGICPHASAATSSKIENTPSPLLFHRMEPSLLPAREPANGSKNPLSRFGKQLPEASSARFEFLPTMPAFIARRFPPMAACWPRLGKRIVQFESGT